MKLVFRQMVLMSNAPDCQGEQQGDRSINASHVPKPQGDARLCYREALPE